MNQQNAGTPLKRLAGLDFEGVHAYIKDESWNPSGTIKDRRNSFVVQEALRLGVDKLALITAGSNGYSLATLAPEEIKVVAIVDRSLSASVKRYLSKAVYQLIELNLQHKILRPEELISFVREREDEVIWDVTNGYEEGYVPIVAELKELNPDYIVVPVGSGGIYVGVVEGVRRYRLKTKVIGIGVQNTLKSFADKLYTPWTPYTKVMAKYHEAGHTIYRLDENEVKETWQRFQHVARLEPSSAVVFAALEKAPFTSTDTIVFINSGNLSLE